MAQQPKAPKQQDPYVQRGKTLTSAVQRLRGWVGSDPSRTPELADALVVLTTHRLLGHAYTAAATDAQEAVRYAAQLLTANGPIGPYTSTSDAARYVTAVVQLATIQIGVGLPDVAGRTMASVEDMTRQLADAGVELELSSHAEVWALSGSARVALAAGDVGAANADADAALGRSIESGLLEDPESIYLAVDVERLVSDARWAAGRAEPALGYLLSAKSRFDAFAGDRLREPGRVGEAVLERLAEPLPGLYGDAADRLMESGEAVLGLTVRRTLINMLQGLVGRLGDAARSDLASAQATLAADLEVERTHRGPLASSSTSEDVPALDRERQRAAVAWLDQERPNAQRLEQERRDAALAEAEHRQAKQRAEERAAADREAAERAAAEEAERRAAQVRAAVEEVERLERKRRREERLEAHRLEVEEREAAQREAERREIERREVERRQADPAEMEQLELERMQTELAELERAEVERAEAERAEAERAEAEQAEAEQAERLEERLEAQRLAAEELAAERAEMERQERAEAERRDAERERRVAERLKAERQEAERQEAEREQEERREAERQEEKQAEAERREAARVEAERLAAQQREAELQEAADDELREALRRWDDLKVQGDRRGARAANERVVELLRPRAEADLAQFGAQLVTALEELSRARLRGGDIFGSRAPAREAKQLARVLDH